MSDLKDFVIENGVLTEYVGNGGDVVIPKGVTKIYQKVFSYEKLGTTNIDSVVIPDTVKDIGGNAFEGCTAKIVVLPKGIKEIKARVFQGSKIESIDIPGNVKSTGMVAFGYCYNLKNVVLQEGVEVLGARAFECCGTLESVQLPTSLTTIEREAFLRCKTLREISIPENVKEMGRDVFLGCENLKILRLPVTMKTFDMKILGVCPTLLALVTPGIKPEILPVKLQKIAAAGFLIASNEGAFPKGEVFDAWEEYAKKSIVKKPQAYYDVALEETMILNALMSQNLIPLKDIDSLIETAREKRKIEVVALLMDYKNKSFTQEAVEKDSNQKLEKEINAPTLADLKKIWAFEKKKDGTIKLLSYKGKEKDVVIPEYFGSDIVTELGEKIFYSEHYHTGQKAKVYREIKSIIIPNTVQKIGSQAFSGCVELKSIVLPLELKVLEEYVFHECESLSEIVLPVGMTTIKAFAITLCYGLQKIEIPDSVVQIEEDAIGYNDQAKIYASEGSAADKYAKKNGIPFVLQ